MACLYYMHKQRYSHVSFFFVIFLRHCVMSQLHYQCFCQDNTFNDIFGYVQVTHKRTVVITLFFHFSLCHTLHYVTTTFFQLPKKLILNNIRNGCLLYVLITSGNTIQLLCVLGPHFWILFLNYIVTYFYYVTITLLICSKGYFFDDLSITLNYGNCWKM